MANTFVNPVVVARRCIEELDNNLVFGKLVYRDYENEWMKQHNGWEPGASIRIKCPIYARVQDGSDCTSTIVDMFERYETFTLSYRKHVAYKITAEQMTYNIDKFQKRFIEPSMRAIANYIDGVVAGLYQDIPAQVGTPGSTPDDFLTYALADARLSDMAVPIDNRHCVINPTAKAYLLDHLKGLNSQTLVNDAVTKGTIGSVANFDMHMSQNIQNHTCGTQCGVAGTVKNGLSANEDETLAVSGGGALLTVTKGDIFTVADCYAVNPLTGANLGYLRQWVVNANASGLDSETLYCTPGTDPWQIRDAASASKQLPYQLMVDAAGTAGRPKNNAAITFDGSAGLVYPVNLAFHKNALALAMVPLNVPTSVTWKAQESFQGYSITVTRGFDILTYSEVLRFDVLFGVKVLNPFMAIRIAG